MEYLSSLRRSFNRFIKNLRRGVSPKLSAANKSRRVYYSKVLNKVEKRPLASFIALLLILLGLIILSNVINRPKPAAEEVGVATKEVQVYGIGESPKITVQAVVEKSGVIKVVALGSGVVQSINVEVGQDVYKGTNLVSMSTNYQGGNVFSVQRQLAQVQYKNVLDTYNTQKDLIQKQRELAEKQDENADELRRISNDSLGASRGLIDLNNSILDTLNSQQTELENTNVNGANDAAILQTKQLRAQLQSGNNQLNSALQNAEYSAGDDNPPAEISNISKDIALKQLDIQEKALKLNKEVSRLNVVLAQINEAIMFPASPVEGKVERIYVKEGQVVNPGTPIAQISGNSKSLIAVALLSRETAKAVSESMVSTLHFGDETYQAAPFYVSTEPTDGQLYSAQFAIPEEYSDRASDRSYILVEIPIDLPRTGSAIPFIPIDAVFQTQDEAFVFLNKNGKATSTKVKLGTVVGRYVEVKEGLKEGDQIILNRNVISGDPVRIRN
jgi:HlyD family secretion protein